MNDDSDNDNEVGYGKPPKNGQFKKGQSGNPKGRSKGVRNFQTEVEAILRSKVTVTRDGRPKSVGTVEAALMRLAVATWMEAVQIFTRSAERGGVAGEVARLES